MSDLTAADDFDAIASMGSAAFLAQQSPADPQAAQPQQAANDGRPETAPQAQITDVNPIGAAQNGTEVNSSGHNAQSEIDWSAFPEPVRAAYEAARKSADEGAQYRRSNEGRLTAHQAKIQKLERELAAFKAANGNPVDDRNGGVNADAIISETRALTRDFPELGPMVKAVEVLAESNKAAHQRFASMDLEAQQAALHRNAAELDKIHPGWTRDLASPAFREWFESAPEFIQQAIRENGDGIRDVKAASYMIGLFKSQTAPQQPVAPQINQMTDRRKQQLAGATNVSAGNRGAADGPPVDDFDANWDHFARRSSSTNG